MALNIFEIGVLMRHLYCYSMKMYFVGKLGHNLIVGFGFHFKLFMFPWQNDEI